MNFSRHRGKQSHASAIYNTYIITTISFFILTQFSFISKCLVNGEEWAVHVEDGEVAANQLANRHNLVNLGEVLPDSSIYHFSLKKEHRGKRSAEHISNIHKLLEESPETKWTKHQAILKRTKRVPLTREKRQLDKSGGRACYISTVGTEQKESRRCVFPFEYKGKAYLGCTSDFSSNKKEWCATEVKGNGEVVIGQWGDCDKESVVCYTTKVVVEKESIGSKSQGTVRTQNIPSPGNANVRQRLPVNAPRQRPNVPPPPQRNNQRPNFPPQSVRRPPQFTRPGIAPQRPSGFPPRQRIPQGTNEQGVPRQFIGGFPPRPNQPRQQSFNPKVLPPLTRPTNPQRLSQDQILALLQNKFKPPQKEEVPIEVPKLEELKTKWNDPYWPQMWFLNRGNDEDENGLDMNVEEAWKKGVSGKGVVITILDDGVEWSHPDLEKNYDPAASTDLNDRDADPFPRYDIFNSNKHGTRCAGQVSAAANNSKCGVGIAYQSKIGGVRVLDGAIVDALEAEALSFNRSHIDIYSASWGPDDDGRTVDGPGPLASLALKEGALKGRKGLGSIFVWASGNGGKHFDNCNTDGYTTSIYTLSISSVSEKGSIPWYSEPCSSSIATTYSSGSTKKKERKVVTTDLRGECTTQHTGTSASSPIAAGIVALGLETNSKMTWRDIQHLVVRTARPRGNLKAHDWRVNGVGLHFSHSYGFGLMDAGLIVQMAKNWKTVPQHNKCTYRQTIQNEELNYLILPGKEESTSIIVENKGCVEKIKYLEHFHIQISLSSETSRGDLTVSVISPMGTKSELLGPRPFDDIHTGFSLFRKWPMMSVHFWGENPIGKWTLLIRNRDQNSGRATLRDWQMIFYGTETDPQPGLPLKPNYKEPETKVNKKLNSNGRKVDLNKMKTTVEFTNNRKQTLKHLIKICPACFGGGDNSNGEIKSSLNGSVSLKDANLKSTKDENNNLSTVTETKNDTSFISESITDTTDSVSNGDLENEENVMEMSTVNTILNEDKLISNTTTDRTGIMPIQDEPKKASSNETTESTESLSDDDFDNEEEAMVMSTINTILEEDKLISNTMTDRTAIIPIKDELRIVSSNETTESIILPSKIENLDTSEEIMTQKSNKINKKDEGDNIEAISSSTGEENEPRSLDNEKGNAGSDIGEND